MILKSTIQHMADKKTIVSVSTESIVETEEEALDFGDFSARLTNAFLHGFGEADVPYKGKEQDGD